MKGLILSSEITKDKFSVIVDEDQLATNSDYFQTLNVPAIFSGAGTVGKTATLPGKVGDIYVDTANSKMYGSKGTLLTDWFILN